MKKLLLVALLCVLLPLPARAAVTFRAAGTFTAAIAATCTAPMPAGVAADDILLLVVETENQTISLSTANGFAEVTNSPQSAGTAATSPASRLAVFWKRAVGGDAAPVVATATDHSTCRLYAFVGAANSGNPWDITAGGNDSGANDLSAVIPGATTTVANTFVVLITSVSNNATATTNCTPPTNADLTNITERGDNSNTAGLGGGHCLYTADKATAGAYAASTVTISVSGFKGAMSIALKPFICTGVCVDSNSTDATQAHGTTIATAATGYSFNSGAGTVLYVCATASTQAGVATDITGVTYGGSAMTLVSKLRYSTNAVVVSIWRLLSPAAGANTVSMTVTSAGTLWGWISGAVSITGNDGTTPEGTPQTNTGAGTSATVVVSGTTAGNKVIDCMANGSGWSSAGTGMNQLWHFNQTASSAGDNAAQQYEDGGGSVTMAYNVASDSWGIVAVEVLAPTGAPPPASQGMMGFWGSP